MVNVILNKKVGWFAQNNIDKYRRNYKISLNDSLNTFTENDFVLFVDDDNNFKGYLDLSDVEEINKLLDEGTDKTKEVKNLIESGKLKILRQKYLYDDEPLTLVLEVLKNSNQKYLPVFDREKNLLGRVSAEIINKRIKNLYSDVSEAL